MSGKRNIFEEVGSDEKAEAAVVGRYHKVMVKIEI